MTSLRHRLRRLVGRGRERGSGGGAALMLLILAMGMFMVLGLVIDGGSRAQALDRADRIAGEAARAGLQAAVVVNGTVDAGSVDGAVQQYLAVEGVSGTSTVEGTNLHVHVTITEPTKVLGIIGIESMTITGDGSADLIYR